MRESLRSLPVLLLATALLLLHPGFLAAGTSASFRGKVTDNNINIRVDSTPSAEVICTANKGDVVEVISELYDWYKIRLPKGAPLFIRKDMVDVLDENTAKVARHNVNLRLHPTEASPILGKAGENEVVRVHAKSGDWYRIEPVSNSFGWIHRQFVKRLSEAEAGVAQPPQEGVKVIRETIATPSGTAIVIEGTVRPKTIKTVATHKLICQDRKVFLLRGDRKSLDALNYRRVKITGQVNDSDTQELPVIDIVTMEALD